MILENYDPNESNNTKSLLDEIFANLSRLDPSLIQNYADKEIKKNSS